jgi:hypothetical protein
MLFKQKFVKLSCFFYLLMLLPFGGNAQNLQQVSTSK